MKVMGNMLLILCSTKFTDLSTLMCRLIVDTKDPPLAKCSRDHVDVTSQRTIPALTSAYTYPWRGLSHPLNFMFKPKASCQTHPPIWAPWSFLINYFKWSTLTNSSILSLNAKHSSVL